MFSAIKKLFSPPRPILTVEDRDFGTIRYDPPNNVTNHGCWQMDDKWRDTTLSSASIPGDESGPFERERRFLLEKFNSTDEIWDLCSCDLFQASELLIKEVTKENLREIFFITCINTDLMDSDDFEWEVCFESKNSYKWLYVGLQIARGQVESNTIDT